MLRQNRGPVDSLASLENRQDKAVRDVSVHRQSSDWVPRGVGQTSQTAGKVSSGRSRSWCAGILRSFPSQIHPSICCSPSTSAELSHPPGAGSLCLNCLEITFSLYVLNLPSITFI